ncbi:phosphonate ABC transporter, ATP-binding protein PhnC [Variovorax paradoxus B4]|uniref:Phosphate-import ATP-binding protein PhnC n=2 Tax=Variovorax paradoxus TaxID=34073 RepID=A0A0H2LR53_VARPD|nr:ATP-binding cassette domain-containing protein [Variovorax paradoxus]AGU49312.1 phosphonate ABC transporter, ATP-binding protein PhnC [Variovorax paradoxus B4]KLN52176.1 phosphate-import ATP-binding protein PhnC [Variovorax paradoxus]
MNIELRSLSGRHPAAPAAAPPALRALDLHVAAGEQAAVIGPSGAGKTTLLHLMACALAPAAGSIELDGRDPWRLPRRELQRLRGRLFLAPQVPPLPPRQRVVTAVLAGRLPRIGLWQALRSLFYPTGIAQADAALARFDMADKLFARVDRLSGGERQRVGLARGLLSQAQLLLVDEPLSALDPARAGLALDTLTQWARDSGATLVATLHDVPLALQHFPRIIGLRGGSLAFDLPTAQVTPALLRELYAQEPAQADALGESTVEARPVVMHCR